MNYPRRFSEWSMSDCNGQPKEMYKFMNKPVNEIVNKWKTTGLLKGLSEEKKTRCAISLEDLASFLMKQSNQLNETYGAKRAEDICGNLIPIMRRVYNENIRMVPSAEMLYEDYVSNVAGDPEAALCDLYVKDFVKRTNK